MDYKSIIEAPYNRKNWQELLHDIFTSRIKFYAPQEVQISTDTAKSAYYLGKITLADGKVIAVYEVQLSDNVVIERNKVSIRNLLVQHWRNNGFSGAFMFCHKDTDSVLRFSYVSEILAFNEDGKLETNKTDTKRFTYYLGEGHRNRTAIDQFTKLKGSGQTLNDITKAFSIEALSDSFFAGYKNIYEDIVEYMTGKRMSKVKGKWEEVTIHSGNQEIINEFATFENPLKAMRDYVKKLMGRLVFLQFIQKKGWLGVQKNDEWGTGDKEFMLNLFTYSKNKSDFIEKVLEPLFNDINTLRKNDLVSDINVGTDIKVPFLNGGLFERDKEDENTIKLPSKYFKELFDFFSQYNFTIDENDPNDTEVGVDPEMLGRIFENLLEDNKDKGAFYTPKEIVRFMCTESLIAYLQTDISEDLDKGTIRNFVSTHESSYLSNYLILFVKQKLEEVKICDPAIGSGAFTIGMLNELFACYEALEGEQANRPEIKRHIIQNSIYGVDIEKGAVDIARLRFWLSLVVDEDKPDALPNLDFKIMQGNSLLEQYNGVDLSELVMGKKVNMQMDIFDTNLKQYRSNLNNLIKDYFSTNDHLKKVVLKKQIQINVNEQMKAADIDVDFNSLGIDIAGNDQFFLWHTWFTDVFNRVNGCNGFDIVIGNPPYVQLQNNGGELGKLYRPCKYKTFNSMGDLYSLFYERGWQMLKEGGFLCFITSNKWMRAGYGKETREFFANHTNPIQLIDFAGVKIFDSATVDTNILLFENAPYKGKTVCTVTKGESKNSLQNLSVFVQHNYNECTFKKDDSWLVLSPIEQSIKDKIESVGTPLKDWNIQINYGIKTGCNEAFIITTEMRDKILSNCKTEYERQGTAELIRPILRGRDIKKYGYDFSDVYLIATFPSRHYDIELYPAVKDYLLSFGMERLEQTGKEHVVNNQRVKARKKTNNKWFETQDSINYWDDFNKLKICWNRIASEKLFALVDEGIYIHDSMHFFTGEHLQYLNILLNSNLYKFLMNIIVGDAAGGNAGNADNVKNLRAILPDKQQEDKLLSLFEEDKIFEIDKYLFQLYSLTEGEIVFIQSPQNQ